MEACVLLLCWSAVDRMMVILSRERSNLCSPQEKLLQFKDRHTGSKKRGKKLEETEWKCQCFRCIWQSGLQDKEMMWKYMWETWSLSSQWGCWRQQWVKPSTGQVNWLQSTVSKPYCMTNLHFSSDQEGQSYLTFLLSLRFAFSSTITVMWLHHIIKCSSPHFTSCLS